MKTIKYTTVKYANIDQEELINFYLSGHSMEETKRHFSVNINFVSRVLKNRNISTKLFKKDFNRITWEDYDMNALMEKHRGSINSIFKETGIPWAHIKKYITDNNIKTDNQRYIRHSHLTQETKENIIELYLNGNSIKSISKILHIHSPIVKKILDDDLIRILRQHGIEKRKAEFFEYTKRARRLSRTILGYYNKKKIEGFHWNHKFSILHGFINNVPLEIIAGIANQELITMEENMKQGSKSKITLDELKSLTVSF